MSAHEPSEATSTVVLDGYWDGLIEQMKAYRESVGSPSYQSLADRVAAARVERGVDAYAARVGKTTIYDCFRTGRPRVNLTLVREVALAMGATDEQVDGWEAGCRTPVADSEADAGPVTVRAALAVAVSCVALGLLGRSTVVFLDLPLHLDMVGTAIAAFVLGPWHGVAVGVAVSTAGVGISGASSLPFALVQVAGALAWGYGTRRWRAGESVVDFTLLTVAVAVLCSVVATPIIIMLASWEPRASFDSASAAFATVYANEAVNLFAGNAVTSVLDKFLSAFVALVVISCLPRMLSERLPLAARLSHRG